MPSYEKRGKKQLWSVRFSCLENGIYTSKRLSGFKTKAEAQAAWKAYTPPPITKGSEKDKTPFITVCNAYLESQRNRVKHSSYVERECRLKKIIPYFEGIYLQDIKPLDILNWQATLNDYSATYIGTLRGQLSSVLLFGERYFDIPSVMRKVEPFRKPPKAQKLRFWTEEEFRRFMDALPEEKTVYRLFFRFLYVMGCRKGEALALEWKDLDKKKKTISITKSLTEKGKNGREITSPKNESSIRTLDLPQRLFEDMVNFQKENANSVYIFGGQTPLATSPIDRLWHETTAKAGLPKIRIHDLRHSCASLLISRGISIVAVSKRLGHSDTEQTLNTYAHLLPRDAERILSELKDF